MTASRDKGSHMYGLESVCTFPNRQSLQMAPAPACKHCSGKELTEPSNLSDHDVNAGGYYRLPADSYAAIDMGKRPQAGSDSGDACCNFRSDVYADWRGDSLI